MAVLCALTFLWFGEYLAGLCQSLRNMFLAGYLSCTDIRCRLHVLCITSIVFVIYQSKHISRTVLNQIAFYVLPICRFLVVLGCSIFEYCVTSFVSNFLLCIYVTIFR